MHMAHHDNPAHVGLRTKTHKLIFYYGCNYDGGYRTRHRAGNSMTSSTTPTETVNIYDEPGNKDSCRKVKSSTRRLAAEHR